MVTCGVIIVDSMRLRSTPTEKSALIAFYNALDGDHWLNTWNLTDSISSWSGVEVDGDGHVVSLSLSEGRLSGIFCNSYQICLFLLFS